MPKTSLGWIKIAMNVVSALLIGYASGDIAGAITAAAAILAGLFQKQPE